MEQHIVIGPPGTGKTTYISRQVQRALQTTDKNKIVICSLTKSAARVASGKIELPDSNIGTLHSFAYRALGSPKIAETNTSSWNRFCPRYMINQQTASLDYMVDETPENTPGYTLLSGVSLQRQKRQPIEKMESEYRDFWRLWSEWKKENGFLDFTDLLERALSDTLTFPGDPEIVFADECQDFSRLEIDLLYSWSRQAKKLITVGDRLQSLYQWRGSEPFYALPDNQKNIILSQSYRVPSVIVDYSLNFISRSKNYRDEVYKGKTGEQGEIKKLTFSLDQKEDLLNLIERETELGDVVMVLASCSYMLDKVVRLLKSIGFPFYNPYRVINGQWNPISYKKGSARNRLLAMLKFSHEKTPWSPEDCKLIFEHLAVKSWLNPGHKKNEITELPDDLHYLDVAEQLRKCVNREVLEKLFAGDVNFFYSIINQSKKKSFEYCINCYNRYGYDAIKNEPRLIIGTIHSVKGGECDTVILSPDISHAAEIEKQRFGDSPHRSVFYVGMTRARKKLYFLSPSSGCYMDV